MSWHFSQALVVAYLEQNSSDGAPSAQSKSRNTRGTSYLRGKTTARCLHSQSGMMSEPSTERRGVDWWMSSLRASRAKTSVCAERAKDSMAKGRGCGRKLEESLARFDRSTSSWKTHQLSLFGGQNESLETWPRWATWDATGVWVDSPSVAVPTESACGLSLLRPTAQCWRAWTFRNLKSLIRRNHADGNLQEQSARCYHKMITPTSNEILMMWPVGWTDLKPLATDKTQSWLLSRGIPCDVAEDENAELKHGAKNQ